MLAMESLTSSFTSLSEMEGISDEIIEKLCKNGIENVERILELGEETIGKIPDFGEETVAEIMAAARDLFEEVEIEVPEGVELPTAIAGSEIDSSKNENTGDSNFKVSETPITEDVAKGNAE
jgi:ribosomal protein S13